MPSSFPVLYSASAAAVPGVAAPVPGVAAAASAGVAPNVRPSLRLPLYTRQGVREKQFGIPTGRFCPIPLDLRRVLLSPGCTIEFHWRIHSGMLSVSRST